MTVRIAALTSCIIVLILAVTVVAPRFANDRSGNAGIHTSAKAQASPTAANEHSAPHADHAAEFDVAGLLTTDRQSLRFCAVSALQPFEAALQQIEAVGAGEAATRFETCLLETMLYHAPLSTVQELSTHHDHFVECFAALTEQRSRDQAQAGDAISACVATGQH